jgi:hypothetical protein
MLEPQCCQFEIPRAFWLTLLRTNIVQSQEADRKVVTFSLVSFLCCLCHLRE